VGAVSVLNETFATDSAFTKADADGAENFFAGPSSNRYWGINDPDGNSDDYDGGTPPAASEVPDYTLFSGNFFNGEFVSANGDTQPMQLDWSDLDISGKTDIMFSGLFAANGDFEDAVPLLSSSDYIRIQYRIDSDSGAFTNLLWFSAETMTLGTDPLSVDANFDGIGTGIALTLAAQSFSASIADPGSTLDLRILMTVQTLEEIAFDSISVTAALLGDYNENDTIDAADYTVWRDALTAGATSLANDPTPGTVDESDFVYWRDHYGGSQGSGAGSAAAVPEPNTLALLFLGSLLTLAVGRRKVIVST
jgi:hypothetical protein